jgi:thymidylate synthase (FAD)
LIFRFAILNIEFVKEEVMDRIKVELISHSPIRNAIIGARTCWDSFNRDDYKSEESIGTNNSSLLRKLVHEYKHESVIEHINYTFKIEGASRLMLQELARHRIASYSVQSTRYVLKKLLNEDADYFELGNLSFEEIKRIVKKYLVIPKEIEEDKEDVYTLFWHLRILYFSLKKYKQDVAKYFLPESFRTKIIWTINARSLRNFLELRLNNSAHFEIRRVAFLTIKALPKSHIILFEDILEKYRLEV